MKNNWLKKSIVTVILLLFIGVSVLSSVSSEDVSASNDIILEDKNEIGLEDNNEEVLTRITAFVMLDDIKSNNGLIVNIELLDSGFEDSSIDIFGFKKPLYPLRESFFKEKPKHLIAPQFIGLTIPVENLYVYVIGYAFGNIEWE